jgi:hypothetical protein
MARQYLAAQVADLESLLTAALTILAIDASRDGAR